MKSLALALVLLLSGQAVAGDAPLLEPVPGGVFINDSGMHMLNLQLADYQRRIAALAVENEALKASTEAMAAKPALTVKAVVILIGLGVVIGAGATATIVAVAR